MLINVKNLEHPAHQRQSSNAMNVGLAEEKPTASLPEATQHILRYSRWGAFWGYDRAIPLGSLATSRSPNLFLVPVNWYFVIPAGP